ncbi:MAG TPA: nuclear transport factor 2 family protein [Kofleriaceae bacterium]|nr:nuclear transport factor 2 family protein [Kofleriaceae bacterium]
MSPAETAARRYIAAWLTADAAERTRLLEQCFADDGRIVLRGIETRGRAALAQAIEQFAADPRRLTARITDDVEAQDPLFRFRAVFDHPDGARHSSVQDLGEVDASGRITTIYSFID